MVALIVCTTDELSFALKIKEKLTDGGGVHLNETEKDSDEQKKIMICLMRS